jgi:hypothetical protein
MTNKTCSPSPSTLRSKGRAVTTLGRTRPKSVTGQLPSHSRKLTFAVGCTAHLAPIAVVRQGVSGGRHAREVLSAAIHVRRFSSLARRRPCALLTPRPQR